MKINKKKCLDINIIPALAQYSFVGNLSCDMAVVKLKTTGLYGYINKDLEEVIPCTYVYAKSFIYGATAVIKRDENNLIYIDKNNNELKIPKHNFFSFFKKKTFSDINEVETEEPITNSILTDEEKEKIDLIKEYYDNVSYNNFVVMMYNEKDFESNYICILKEQLKDIKIKYQVIITTDYQEQESYNFESEELRDLFYDNLKTIIDDYEKDNRLLQNAIMINYADYISRIHTKEKKKEANK